VKNVKNRENAEVKDLGSMRQGARRRVNESAGVIKGLCSDRDVKK
jgi:hypothetical protein